MCSLINVFSDMVRRGVGVPRAGIYISSFFKPKDTTKNSEKTLLLTCVCVCVCVCVLCIHVYMYIGGGFGGEEVDAVADYHRSAGTPPLINVFSGVRLSSKCRYYLMIVSMFVSKETNRSVKRDLVKCQKRPSTGMFVSKGRIEVSP
jgi:hypothetical protein